MVKFCIFKADITKIQVDAIVNAANTRLLGGGGVDGAIHRAGGPAIMQECDLIRRQCGGCATGQAVVTTAGNLPAGYVIHTVGPIWNEGRNNESKMLESCYLSCLQLAEKHKLERISFPNISTGIYGFPKHQAATLAIETAEHYFKTVESTISELNFVCFDDDNYTIYQHLISEQ